MKLFLTLIATTLISFNSFAACSIAIGGPGARPEGLKILNETLKKTMKNHDEYEIDFFTVANLADVLDSQPDYMIYLKQNEEHFMEVQIRNILTNSVIQTQTYNPNGSFSEVSNLVARDFEKNALSKLKYCTR
nr:hypothetical protein BHI3_12220 [Bacteriovorax sp. HI3]